MERTRLTACNQARPRLAALVQEDCKLLIAVRSVQRLYFFPSPSGLGLTFARPTARQDSRLRGAAPPAMNVHVPGPGAWNAQAQLASTSLRSDIMLCAWREDRPTGARAQPKARTWSARPTPRSRTSCQHRQRHKHHPSGRGRRPPPHFWLLPRRRHFWLPPGIRATPQVTAPPGAALPLRFQAATSSRLQGRPTRRGRRRTRAHIAGAHTTAP